MNMPMRTMKPKPTSIKAASVIANAITKRLIVVVTEASYEKSLVCHGVCETLAFCVRKSLLDWGPSVASISSMRSVWT